MIEFEAEVEEASRGGALIAVPFDAKETFGSGRPKIIATFDGEPYRGSIVSMGGRYVLGISKAIRATIGKDVGDAVRVTVALDTEERTVEVPNDLASALEGAGKRAAFDALSYTRRKEAVRDLETAKKSETRARRLTKIVDTLP